MPVIARVVDRRLATRRQDQINNGIAILKEWRFRKHVRKVKVSATSDVETLAADTPEITAAIRDARQVLVKRPLWNDLDESTQQALLEASDRMQRGMLRPHEWAKHVAEAQNVRRGVVPVVRSADPNRNRDMTRLPFGL